MCYTRLALLWTNHPFLCIIVLNVQVESNQGNSSTAAKGSHKTGKLTDIEIFTGFKPAIEACFLDWDDHPIPGVTYGKNAKYLCPFTVFRHPTEADELVRAGGQVNSSQAVLRCEFPGVSKSHSPRTGHRSRTQSESQGPGGAGGTSAKAALVLRSDSRPRRAARPSARCKSPGIPNSAKLILCAGIVMCL